MKKLICATAVSLCTVPAMAAPLAHPLLARTSPASHTAASVPELPLPPLQLETSLAVPGFGKTGHDLGTKSVNLPGLGSVTYVADNPAKGNGTAKYSEQIAIDPDSPKTPTRLAADYGIPEGSHQLTAKYSVSGAGFGKATDPSMKVVTLPNLGTLSSDYANGGKGDTLNASFAYTTPAPK